MKEKINGSRFKIGDYDVIVDEHSWNLYTTSIATNPEAKDYGKERLFNHGYFSSLESLIKKIARMDALKKAAEEEITDLRDFLSLYNDSTLQAIDNLTPARKSITEALQGFSKA